jgi:serine palmitoyltransferase
MADLERVLKEVTAGDKSKPRRALEQRRFIIVEGIYANYGDIAPLDQIVDLKEKFLFRLVLDESLSLGVLGVTGRGALEHLNVDRADVEIAIADLANAFATVGGVCCRRSCCCLAPASLWRWVLLFCVATSFPCNCGNGGSQSD